MNHRYFDSILRAKSLATTKSAPQPEQPSMVCAWCGRELRPGKGQLSHGICLRCTKGLEAEEDEREKP